MRNSRSRNASLTIGPSLDHCRWGLALLSCVAVISTLVLSASGQAGPPSQKTEQDPSPPAAPEALAPGTVAVDLTKAHDPNEFRKDVTQDQRIHVHIDFGRVFESQGNFEAALAEYQQALAACEHKGIGRTRSADEALAHRRIGNALDRLGRFAQAEMHYKKALKLSPRDPKIWNDAGYSYYLQGRWADAERTFKSGSRLAPEDVKLKTNLGLTLAAAGRTKEALPLLSQYSGDAIGHANLGFLLAATGQVELARQQYLQALALRPSLALARRALAQLDRAQDAEAVAAAGQAGAQPVITASARASDDTVLKAATTRSRIPPARQSTAAPPSEPPLSGP
ncbi:MAG: tetratricopeptide repeat protein [Planctomycetaceae bacterium]|nr:tetratricopeptide repeat protein [Planctomycetaceae bacterium]